MTSSWEPDEYGLEVGSIETEGDRRLHVFARPKSAQPFVIGISGGGRKPFAVRLTPHQLEALLTLLDVAARSSPA